MKSAVKAYSMLWWVLDLSLIFSCTQELQLRGHWWYHHRFRSHFMSCSCTLLYPCSPWYDASDEWLFTCSGDATQVDPALGPVALGLGRPGALPAGLVQPCPKPRALIHKPFSSKETQNEFAYFSWSLLLTNHINFAKNGYWYTLFSWAMHGLCL